MKNSRVFVSGGAGVIGREMVARLVARGADVLVGDLQPRPDSFPAQVRYRRGDLNTMTRGELEAFAPEVFFHLAATFERSVETYEFWDENFWHNVRLSHHLMTLARELPSLRRVVFASSYLIYEPSLYQFAEARAAAVPLREDLPIQPRNLTGMAKLAHEIELRYLRGFHSDRFTSASARIYRGYGRGSRDVISRWVRDLLAGKTIKVYRPEGIFDYMYAADSAEGLIRLAATDSVTGVINLGTGRGERVQRVVDILGAHFPDMRAEQVQADIPFEASCADMSTYQQAVGWLPEYDLERAIAEIVAYEREASRGAQTSTGELGHVLVSSASGKVPLVRAMGAAARRIQPQAKVIAGDISAGVLSRHVADAFWQMPRTTAGNADLLLSGCLERGVTAVLPTRDGELGFWAEQRDRFAAAGIKVLVSPAEGIRVCYDKLAFAAFGRDRGLPFIAAATSPDDLGSGPFVVKERFGAGGRQVGLNLEREAALAHAEGLQAPIFQPFVGGREISIDAWLDRAGCVKGLVLRGRDTVVRGESQVTTTFRDDRIETAAREILEAIGLAGPVVMQALIDAQGELHVIECNPRFGGASTTALEAGLDSFYWSLLEACGEDVGAYPFDRVAGEVRQVRVPHDIIFHGVGFDDMACTDLDPVT